MADQAYACKDWIELGACVKFRNQSESSWTFGTVVGFHRNTFMIEIMQLVPIPDTFVDNIDVSSVPCLQLKKGVYQAVFRDSNSYELILAAPVELFLNNIIVHRPGMQNIFAVVSQEIIGRGGIKRVDSFTFACFNRSESLQIIKDLVRWRLD